MKKSKFTEQQIALRFELVEGRTSVTTCGARWHLRDVESFNANDPFPTCEAPRLASVRHNRFWPAGVEMSTSL